MTLSSSVSSSCRFSDLPRELMKYARNVVNLSVSSLNGGFPTLGMLVKLILV